ncbi:MAG: phosphatase PAP2 family protein [Clostridium sp.]|nr:phosphatase PAP2 family protein [Clostridium sp.]
MNLKKILPNVRAMCFMMPLLILNLTYAVLDYFTSSKLTLITSIDRSIPFVRQFVIPYVMWYPMVPLVFIYICVKDKENYCRMIISFAFSLITCYIIFFFFQTTVPRPAVTGNDVYSNLVKLIYSIDNPYNCFPSIHVMICALMIEGIWKTRNKSNVVAVIVTFIGISVMLSTVFIKQHVVLDGVSGIMVASIVYFLANKIIRGNVLGFCRRLYRSTDFSRMSKVKSQ